MSKYHRAYKMFSKIEKLNDFYCFILFLIYKLKINIIKV